MMVITWAMDKSFQWPILKWASGTHRTPYIVMKIILVSYFSYRFGNPTTCPILPRAVDNHLSRRSMRISWKWNQRYVYLYNLCCRSYMGQWSKIHEAHRDIWESSRLTKPYPHTVQATRNWRETHFVSVLTIEPDSGLAPQKGVYMVLPLNTPDRER